MTGDDSYHAHCFKCRSCHNRIDELMFAKTSHGIYCMKCHHQRVARSRRHAQKQKEREISGPMSTPSNPHGRPPRERLGVSRVCCFPGVTADRADRSPFSLRIRLQGLSPLILHRHLHRRPLPRCPRKLRRLGPSMQYLLKAIN